MIFKSDLVDAINDLCHDLVALSVRVKDLEDRATCAEMNMCKCKNHTKKTCKATNAKAQPRDKSGKFAKGK